MLRGGHVAQHALRVERPAVVGADDTVVAAHVRHPAHVQRRAAVRANVCAAASDIALHNGGRRQARRTARCCAGKAGGAGATQLNHCQAGGAHGRRNPQTLAGGTTGCRE